MQYNSNSMDLTKKLKKHLKRTNTFPNNNLLFLALLFFIIFLLVEITLRIWDLYKHIPIVDVPSHFFAGMAIACAAYWIYTLSTTVYKKTMAIVITIVTSLIWEALEIIQERLAPDPPYLKDVFFWDGFWDTIVAILGGFILLYIILPALKKKTNLLNNIELK